MNEWLGLIIALSSFASAVFLFYISHLIKDIRERQKRLEREKIAYEKFVHSTLERIRDVKDEGIRIFYESPRGGKK